MRNANVTNKHNVRRDQIQAFGSIIPALYSALTLREMLALITGEEVLESPYARP